MSVPGPFGGSDPFEGMPIFRDLAKMFTASGPVNWEIARQVALWVATDGAAEANVEPTRRIRFEELARVAEMHVAEATGISTSATGRAVSVVPVGRGPWAMATLDAYRPLLERLAAALSAGTPEDDPDAAGDPTAALLGNIGQLMGPVMLGMQSGFTVGHLARGAFGQYGLPVPRPPSDELLLVPVTIDAFAADWSLPEDDVVLWVELSEIAHHAVLSRPHVRARFDELLAADVSGFRPDPGALEGKLDAIDLANPAALQDVLGDPEVLLGAMQTPEQRETLSRLEALVAVVEGYVDHVVDTVGRRLIGSYGPLTEALRRKRVERGDADTFVERLFGLELGQAQFERGAAFVAGIVERAGEDGLARLWRSERDLPTPAEIDAPGLWLARLEYDTA
jgi:putative hydrolase